MLKQVTARASRANKSLFQGSSSSSNRREAMLSCVHPELRDRPVVFQRSNNEEEEQCGEEDESAEEDESEEEAEVECVMRQIRKRHMVAPPIAPTREDDRVLIKPLGDR
jgi:hypothetical protein